MIEIRRETLRITPGCSIEILDRGDGSVEVWLEQGTSSMIGLGRDRELALESARTTLQQALNHIDVAIAKGPKT